MNPIQISIQELQTLPQKTLHSLACNAADQFLWSRLILGRCLVALDRTGEAATMGYSSACHYGIVQLGLSYETVLELRRVALALEKLRAIDRYGVTQKNVQAIICRRSWRHLVCLGEAVASTLSG